MTPAERVRRTVLFESPDELARDLPAPWGSDFIGIGPGPDPDWKPSVEGEDEFACVWHKLHKDQTHGQCIGHPLADYARLKDYRFPRFGLACRYEGARAAVAANTVDKFVLAWVPLSFIHRLEYLRGHVEAWSDPYEHPDELHDLLTRLGDMVIESIRHLAAAGAQGIISCDDWGLQDRPMVSPRVFRDHFKPHYARVYGEARRLGLLCFLHSCGHILDLLPDLYEAGLHVIQQDQQENMGVDNLDRVAGGKLCFYNPVDIQKTMVEGSLDDIRAYARHMATTLGRYRGGFISKWYPSPQAVQHSPERIAAMSEAFVAAGREVMQHTAAR